MLASSRKSSRSIHNSRVNGTSRSPISGLFGWLASVKVSTVPAAKFSITSLTGSRTAIARGAFSLRSSRIQDSNALYSIMFSCLVTPMRLQNSRIALGVKPRRRRPEMVGIRGSSQPVTNFSVTSWFSLRLDITVYSRFKRLNSYWRGWHGIVMLSRTQSYRRRLSWNSKVQIECVMPSSASEIQCVKSYIG
ncbi:Uncharacterised protein [Vibrio cholerae]|uniref:Uncharacterized protein n=1 Tax=Vibrio cholerae TaxID=666 RepID=A0A656A9Z6_VIBCL|nr:Uncharacterised protein [Vibrio cholerae]CSB65990.1 Uncharacterised protein [Vibrio cholerae]CSC53792.1 Uncharacterised protein [Vibrio cholerae]CSC86580.1 Uncharacterised protein [Vibrio cholerae]CSD03155.1 Uncharacterised protein [Vibrio cholerae]